MGLGEAALFVGAATLIADLSPPNRRAEAASYFSVAVYGGIGLGPTIGEWVLGDDRYELTFVVASLFAALAAITVLGVPKRVDRSSTPAQGDAKPPLFHRAAFWPGVVLASGIAAFAVFTAFHPRVLTHRRPRRVRRPVPGVQRGQPARSVCSAHACPSGSASTAWSRSRSGLADRRACARSPSLPSRGRCGSVPSSSASGWHSCTRR